MTPRTTAPLAALWRRQGILLLGMLALGLLCGAPGAQARTARPVLTAAASLLLPGVGQMANGDYVTGGAQLGAAFVLSNQYFILTEQDDYLEPKDRVDNEDRALDLNRTTWHADLYGTALNTLAFYSSYGAYRDARARPEERGYDTPDPQEQFQDLALAPFRWDHLSRPSTFLPLLVPLYFLATPPGDEDYLVRPQGDLTRDEIAAGSVFQHHGVAVGEEAFFRGVLNTSLSESLGPTWGLLSSSALFGLGHEGTGNQATTGGAFFFGLYLGWLQQQNSYEIGQGVALHYWWNLLAALASLREQPGREANLLTVTWRY